MGGTFLHRKKNHIDLKNYDIGFKPFFVYFDDLTQCNWDIRAGPWLVKSEKVVRSVSSSTHQQDPLGSPVHTKEGDMQWSPVIYSHQGMEEITVQL